MGPELPHEGSVPPPPATDTIPPALRAVPSLTRSRTAFLAALAVLALALLLAPGALAAEVLTPRSSGGSPNAESIDTLYKVAFGIGVLIFLLVEGVLEPVALARHHVTHALRSWLIRNDRR